MLRTLLLFCLLGLYGIPVRADKTRLTIGPDALSFPQLAAQLSVDGRVVACAPDLKDNATFVYLKNRNWTQITRLLGKALAMRFIADTKKPNTWRMERAPEVLAREQRFRKRLFQNADTNLQHDYGGNRNYSLRDYPHIQAQYEELDRAERALVSSTPSEKVQTSPEFQEIVRRKSELFRLYPRSPGAWLGIHLFRSGKVGTWDEVFRHGEIVSVLNVRDILGNQPPEQLGLDPMQPLLICRLATRGMQSGGTVSLTFYQIGPGGQYKSLSGFQVRQSDQVGGLFLGDARVPRRPSPSLGEEAEAWFKQECRTMEAFLQSPRARKPVPSPNKADFADFSTLIEAHSRALDAETIMELWPQREMCNDFNIGIDRDRQDERTPPREPSEGGVLPVSFTPNPARKQQNDRRFLKNNTLVAGNSLQAVFADNLIGSPGVWTLREQDEVLLVTNRMAFLDRQKRFPLRAFLPLARAGKLVPVPGGQKFVISPEKLHDYAMAVPAEQNVLWLRELDRHDYRSVPMREIAEGISLVKLWYQLPERTRKAMLARLRPTETVSLSGMDIAPRALEELERAMRLNWRGSSPHVWLPNFMQHLRDGKFSIYTVSLPRYVENKEKFVPDYSLMFRPSMEGTGLDIHIDLSAEHQRAQQKP
jgi:hypothetical protein